MTNDLKHFKIQMDENVVNNEIKTLMNSGNTYYQSIQKLVTVSSAFQNTPDCYVKQYFYQLFYMTDKCSLLL